MKKTIVFPIVTVLSISILLMLFSEEEPQIQPAEKNTTLRGVPVSYTTVTPQSYPILIKALGSVVPLWQTTLRAQVDGRVDYISPKLQPGNRVTKGELLLQVDSRPYLAELSEAKSRLAHAGIAYLKEKHEASEAQKNWKRSGLSGKPDSALVFRQPQLDAAQADIQSAKSAIAYAQKKLEETNITAPYDGIVISRTTSFRENLFTGDEIVQLYADKSVEIPVKLDLIQWNHLPEKIQTADVILKEPRLETTWRAEIKRKGQTIEPQSGLRTLYLEVLSPLTQTPPLLPGTFVEAQIKGKTYPGLLRIPETALTKRSRIWLIDENNLLRPHDVKALFYGEGVVYVISPLTKGELRIALKPNNSFVNGQRVKPVTEE